MLTVLMMKNLLKKIGFFDELWNVFNWFLHLFAICRRFSFVDWKTGKWKRQKLVQF